MGDFFGIPTPTNDSAINPDDERDRYTVMNNLLKACTKGILSEVFEDGIYTLIDNGDGTYSLTLAASGGIRALWGVLNGGLIDTYETITWEDMPDGKLYHIYITPASLSYLNPESFTPIYSTFKRQASDYTVLYLATVDLRTGAVLDTNPEGKVYQQDFSEHVQEDTNPHSTNWTQNHLTMFEQIVFDIGVGVSAGAVIPITDARSGTNNTIESTGDISFKDQYQTALRKLSDSSNTYLTTDEETVFGAIEEVFTTSEGFGAVVLHKPFTELKYDVRPVNYINSSGTRKAYAGATNQSLTPSQTNYIFLDNTGTLTKNTTGFPANSDFNLAQVVCNASTVTSFTDSRPFINLEAGLDEHNDATGIQGGNATERYHLTSAQYTEDTQYVTAVQNGLLRNTYFNYIPTSDQKDALAGTYGTPGSDNVYMTETDPQFLKLADREGYSMPVYYNNAMLQWDASPATYTFGEASLDALSWDGIFPLSDANDYSGSGNHLMNTAVVFVAGYHNNCALFNPALSTDLMGFAFNYPAGPFSFTLWVNFNSYPGWGAYYYLIDVWDTNAPDCQWALRFWFDGWDTWTEFVISTNGSTVADMAAINYPISTGNWYHMAGVFYGDGATPFELWVNYNGSYSSNPSPAALWWAWTPFFMGAEADAFGMGTTNFHDGMIDECYITPSALTYAQVGWFYNNGFANGDPRWTPDIFMYLDAMNPKASAGIGLVKSTEKLSFFTPAPIVQQNHISDPAAATATSVSDNTGGAVGGSTEAVTAIGGADQTNINNNFASITDDLNDLIADFSSIRTAVDALNLRLETYGWNKTS